MDICFLKRFLFIPILFFSFLMLEGQEAFAYYSMQTSSHDEKTKNQWLVGIGGGGASRNLPSSTNVSNGTPVPAPYSYDIFSINNPDHVGLITLFGGYQWNCLSSFIPYYNVTLRYEHQLNTSITGTVQQYALPEFTNYNYSTILDSDIISIIGKVGLIKYKCLLPYFSVGIGAAFNHLTHYSESLIAPVDTARISPDYGRNTNTNFAYTIGTGIDIICCKNTWISFAYEYWNLGKVNSGPGTELWSNTRLNFGTLKSNTLLATVTYFLE